MWGFRGTRGGSCTTIVLGYALQTLLCFVFLFCLTFNVEPGGCKVSEDAAHFGSEASFSFLGLIE